ncbi:MAG: 23S rRNA (uracil(1939)-C(5))-methyltransferase RlmD [Gaiellaceae bacterium]
MSGAADPSAARPERGDELELVVDRLAYGGAGVARLDGYVVFVTGAVPGDRVRARVTKRKRAYAEARALELVEPSPDRIEPRSPHPGAPWQVLPYERQLIEKETQVHDALSRIGHFEDPPMAAVLSAGDPWRYRNKVEYSFGESEAGELVLGFHRPGRWNEIDDVTDDVLTSERVDALRARVKDWCRAEGLSAYDRRDGTGFLRNLVVREGRRTGALQVRIVTSPGDFRAPALAAALPDADGVLWTRAAGVAETTGEGETQLLAGAEAIEEELRIFGAALRFRVSPQAFFQVHTEQAERLYAVAAELAGLHGSERVFDLYSGIGTIALCLALRAREVLGIESIEPAVADAIENARRNEVENISFFAGDVRTALRPLVEEAGKPDVVVVDPPRAGLSQKIVRRVLETGASRIVYVSCNPTTLAPNARQIADAGYRLTAVRPVDMFPQTPHIECVALLERAG